MNRILALSIFSGLFISVSASAETSQLGAWSSPPLHKEQPLDPGRAEKTDSSPKQSETVSVYTAANPVATGEDCPHGSSAPVVVIEKGAQAGGQDQFLREYNRKKAERR